jgi:hypothetical protein
MPTLPAPRTVTKEASASRVIAALTYYANPQNPALTTAQFIAEFTPLLQIDALVINRHLILMAGGTIAVRSRAAWTL